MDVGVITAVAMLLIWAVAALAYDGPGWVHILLTAGVTLLIYRVVVRGTRVADGGDREKARKQPG
jgi:uncharacterized membrane protein